MAAIEPIEQEATVPLVPAGVMKLWTSELGRWWPAEYTFSGEALQSITIEPEAGGHCVELDRDGKEVVWGRVLEFVPDERLRLSWEISPERELEEGPESASTVEVSMTETGNGETLVHVVHDDFERHGEAGASYRDALAAEQGWPWLIELFAKAAGADA